MQSQAIFFYLNKVTHTYTFTPHLLGSEYLYTEFCNNNLTPVCPLPDRHANAALTVPSNKVYLGLEESEARTVPKLEHLIPQVTTQSQAGVPLESCKCLWSAGWGSGSEKEKKISW